MKTTLLNLTIKYITGAVIAALLLSACSDSSSSDNDEFEDGVRIEIIDILGEENLNTLENELNMPIHRGQNPPDILGFFNSVVFNQKNPDIGVSFVMAPLILIESLVPGDENRDPDSFWDLYFRFSDQNMDDYTIFFENRHIQESTSTGLSSYIIGEEDMFTIAGEVVRETEEGTVRTVQVISGRVTEEGIAETHFSFIMVDNAGNEDLVDDGTGRTFNDGEGISEPADFPEVEEDAPIKGDEPGFSYWDLFKK